MQNRNESLDNWFFSFRSTNNIKKNKDSNTDSRDFISFSRIFNLSRERKSSVSVDKQSTVPSKRLHGNNLKFFYSRIEKLGKSYIYNIRWYARKTYSSLAFLICGSGLFLAKVGSRKSARWKFLALFSRNLIVNLTKTPFPRFWRIFYEKIVNRKFPFLLRIILYLGYHVNLQITFIN